MMPRIDGAGGPGKRAQDENDGAEGIDALGAAEVRGADQQGDAAEPEDKATENARTGPDPAGAQPIKNHHPERDTGHQERGDPRGDPRFGPGERTVSAEQQEETGNDCRAPLRGCGLFFALITEEWIENQADGEMANSGHNERRNCFDADANEEIGRAPEDVDRGEGD